MSNLTSRILVALVGIPALVGIILYGGVAFLGLIVLASSIGLWEFYRMAEQKGMFPNAVLGIVSGALMQILFFKFSSEMFVGVLSSNTIAAGALTLAGLFSARYTEEQKRYRNCFCY